MTPDGRLLSRRRDAIVAGESLLRSHRIGDGSAFDYLRRSEVAWDELCTKLPEAAAVPVDVRRPIDIRAKYEGYIARQDRQIERFAQMESKLIPTSIDYASVTGLRNEAKQKLSRFTPRSLGQALRISGITPADVTVLAIHLSRSVVRKCK